MSNLLEICEAALRLDGSSPEAERTADIIHLQLLLSQNSETETVIAFARSCVEKHPAVAYFYYAITMCISKQFHALTTAAKGLKCHITTEFIQQELHYHVTHLLYHTLTYILHGDRYDEPRLQTISVLINKAEDHASTFLKIASPDHPGVLEMTAVVTLLNLLMKGHTLTNEELKTVGSNLLAGAQSMADLSQLPKECMALTLILARMESQCAWQCWGPTMSRRHEPTSRNAAEATLNLPPLLAAPASDDHFTAWVERLEAKTPGEQVLEIMAVSIIGNKDTDLLSCINAGPAKIPARRSNDVRAV
ncbi:hypothetical protein FB45DRAFT_902239 [Roridomyces roridus]|uniref:Uncharacterized protein n=1 Tax=Roridomyces roridus TaxID=1738132 RepID=A0AAD7C5B7_9AGAR|nr:hypothetical protein FB45DRAFT_902239 [Roridomyces roridus]